ncbi:54S ribosomal protein L36 mitochondrial [Spathaspora sp. JA1]|nr:54S ribosomal protein L36 mitochondrial [Spathaspora sp. JA1]
MFKHIYKPLASAQRISVRSYAGKPVEIPTGKEVQLSNRRVMRKIRMGKARPAIFYQFDTLVELSDGSVIKRRSQAPKDEIRMISDQRNSSLWNPTRSDLLVDQTQTGKVSKFRSRYGNYDEKSAAEDQEQDQEKVSAEEMTEEQREQARQLAAEKEREFMEFMGKDAEIITHGKLYDRKADKKKK